MPYVFAKEVITHQGVIGFVCDKCGKEYVKDDYEEFQERLDINFVGGFGSIFGDQNRVRGVFCQHCLRDAFGEYLKIDSL